MSASPPSPEPSQAPRPGLLAWRVPLSAALLAAGGPLPVLLWYAATAEPSEVLLPEGWAMVGATWGVVLLGLGAIEILVVPGRTNRSWFYLAGAGAGWLVTASQMAGLSFGAFQEAMWSGVVAVAGTFAAVGFAGFIRPVTAPIVTPPRSALQRGALALGTLLAFGVGAGVTLHAVHHHEGARRSLLFEGAFGLVPHSKVFYRGVVVGYVESAELEAEGVRVTYVLRRTAETCGTLTAELSTDLLSFSRFLDLKPDGTCARPVALSAATITLGREHPPIDQVLVAVAQQIPMDQLPAIIDDARAALAGTRGTLDAARTAAEGVSALLDGPVRETLGHADRTLTRADRLATTVGPVVATTGETLADASSLVAELRSVTPEVRTAVVTTTNLALHLDAGVDRVTADVDCLLRRAQQGSPLALMQFGLRIRLRTVPDPLAEWEEASAGLTADDGCARGEPRPPDSVAFLP